MCFALDFRTKNILHITHPTFRPVFKAMSSLKCPPKGPSGGSACRESQAMRQRQPRVAVLAELGNKASNTAGGTLCSHCEGCMTEVQRGGLTELKSTAAQFCRPSSPSSRCGQGWLFWGPRGDLPQASFLISGGLQAISGTPWLVEASP